MSEVDLAAAISAFADAANAVGLQLGVVQPFLGVFRDHAAAIRFARDLVSRAPAPATEEGEAEFDTLRWLREFSDKYGSTGMSWSKFQGRDVATMLHAVANRYELLLATPAAPSVAEPAAEEDCPGFPLQFAQDVTAAYAAPASPAKEEPAAVGGVSPDYADPPETPVPAGRVEHLTTLLSEALELFGAGSLAEGDAEWIWSQQASAAVSNTCVKCSSPCDGEGDCVSPECCFGRSKLAQVNAAGAGKVGG